MKWINKRGIFIVMLALLLSFGTVTAFATDNSSSDKETKTEDTNASKDTKAETKDNGDQKAEQDEKAKNAQQQNNSFPKEEDLQLIAENENLILKADPKTGQFIVINKDNDQVLRSYPDPEDWTPVGISPAWKYHLQSPFMLSYVEMNVRKDMVKETNLFESKGTAEFKKIDDGYQMTYTLPNLGFVIPIEVHLGKDYVETKILSDGIKDEKKYEKGEKDPKARLVSIRLFPFLAADSSEKEDGYVFLPDGPGVLVNFKKDRASSASLYSERVYGEDWAYSNRNNQSTRQPIRMPVFGIKSGNQGTLGILTEGESYANIVSAPSQSFSQYNWVTAEQLYRFKFFQPTNKKKTEGFLTYSEDMYRTDRAVRYYMLTDDDPDYVDMADRYRTYLMEDKGVEKKKVDDENLDLQLDILGGGTKNGFLWDSFLTLTPTDEATKIVKELSSLGVKDMTIGYLGWQRGGYSEYGGHFPVARKLGGNDGMKEFADFAHAKGFSVFLDTSSYTFNNTGKDGFRASRDGLRDLGSSVIEYHHWGEGDTTFVSPRLMEETIFDDLDKGKSLGVDGYLYGKGIGSWLSTDFNSRYKASRNEVKQIQEDIFEKTKETIGDVQVEEGNFYSLKYSSFMRHVSDDYSYDLFVDKQVPFLQIVLHGLVPYSFDYGNLSGNVTETFLKGIEYGASPSFILTSEDSQKMLDSKSLRRFYTTYYKDWDKEIASQYQRYNEALGDVQGEFITDHNELVPGVFETTYENGKRIIVNYNKVSYSSDDVTVEPENFAVIEGGN